MNSVTIKNEYHDGEAVKQEVSRNHVKLALRSAIVVGIVILAVIAPVVLWAIPVALLVVAVYKLVVITRAAASLDFKSDSYDLTLSEMIEELEG